MPDGVGRVELDLEDLPPDAWPDNAVAFRGIGGGDDQLARGFHSGGTYEGWLAAVQAGLSTTLCDLLEGGAA